MKITNRLKNSSLIKDSFWAIFGNGLGYGILLISGIVIARLLGKDIYGEYGMVKSTMFYIAGFATMGLGITSTKYIAQYLKEDKQQVESLTNDALTITLMSSSFLALLLILFAPKLAEYLEAPGLILAFQLLAIIIIFKSFNTTQNGVLAGFRDFKNLAKNTVISSLIMFIGCVPLTYFFGLKGALLCLAATQLSNCLLNYFSIKKNNRNLGPQIKTYRKKELFLFSFPIALQESSYTITHWGGIMLLVKMSSLGELGLYTAAIQWNAVIVFIPSLLSNVVLSHLSSSLDNDKVHKQTISRMLLVNFICTVIPFLIVYILAPWITTFYGSTFSNLVPLLRIVTFCTIFTCSLNVFNSEFIVKGYRWTLTMIRIFRDVAILALAATWLHINHGIDGACDYAWANVIMTAFNFIILALIYRFKIKNS